MSDYLYDTWLSQYPILLTDLDKTYGGPKYNKTTHVKGRKALCNILTYLSKYNHSSAEDIAKEEFKKRPSSKKKIKSLTDDIRKFIQHNLIPRRIVKEDGIKKIYNKKITTYSLTPFGILYSIHLLHEDKDCSKIINNLAIVYRDSIPKVFDKFKFFKSYLGNDFVDIIGIKELANFGRSKEDALPEIGILGRFVDESGGAYYSDPIFLVGRWTNQISLAIYCNIFNHFAWKAEFEHMNTGEDYDWICKKKIGDFWKEMDMVDPEIKEWFLEYVKEVSFVYRERAKLLTKTKKWFYD
jgi:hypothetical protein